MVGITLDLGPDDFPPDLASYGYYQIYGGSENAIFLSFFVGVQAPVGSESTNKPSQVAPVFSYIKKPCPERTNSDRAAWCVTLKQKSLSLSLSLSVPSLPIYIEQAAL